MVERARHPAETSYLAIECIDPGPETRNSRQRHDTAAINELAGSIQEHGVLQPILVAHREDGRYEPFAAIDDCWRLGAPGSPLWPLWHTLCSEISSR